MIETREILRQMFANLVRVNIDDDIMDQVVPVVDGIYDRLHTSLDVQSAEGQRRLRIALCGVLAHGWAMGVNPFNTPNKKIDGGPVEVRVSRDILVPIGSLKSLRHVKKDSYGRVQKAFFDMGVEERAREQIDRILDDIVREHWPEG